MSDIYRGINSGEQENPKLNKEDNRSTRNYNKGLI